MGVFICQSKIDSGHAPWCAQVGTRGHYPGEPSTGVRRFFWSESEAAEWFAEASQSLTKVRNRRAAEGWFDVVKEDGNEWIDTPPRASTAGIRPGPQVRQAQERAFMLTEAFRKAVRRLPADCVAEAKASASLSALQYGTGQVLVKRALRGLTALPAFLLVPTEPHPDHKAAVEALGVKVVVP